MLKKSRSPLLDRLDMLAGEWTQEAVVDGTVVGTAMLTFDLGSGG